MKHQPGCSKFSDLSRGLLYLTVVAVVVYMVLFRLPVYEKIWTSAMVDNWGRIADSMEVHEAKISAMNDFMGLILGEMRRLNETMQPMQGDVTGIRAEVVYEMSNMNAAIHALEYNTRIMSGNVGVMTNEVGRMRNNTSPGGMMQNMMPWR